jgi:hypothetical protein
MIRTTGCWVAVAAALLLGVGAPGAAAPPAQPEVELRITARTMAAALIQFSEQTGLQLVFPTDDAGERAAPTVQGRFTARAGLERLLRDSGLTYQFVNERTISVSSVRGTGANR